MPAFVVGVALLAPSRASAQLTADQVPAQRTVPVRESLEREMESARLHFGPFFVTPLISVSNAGYDGNVYNQPNDRTKTADWTATVGAGGKAVLPMGSKFYLRLLAEPNYIWYDTQTDLRTWGGDFSASFLALGNRLGFSATGAATKGSTILNSETQANVIETNKNAAGNLEVDITHALSFVAGAQIEDDKFAPGGAGSGVDAEKFSRTDTAALAGLRLRVGPAVTISGGLQGTRSEFDQQPEIRDNETRAYLGGVRYDRPRFFVNLAAGYRKTRVFNHSAFPDYATTVGSYFVSWNVAEPIELQAYGHRAPAYSQIANDQFYVETRNGGGIRVDLGSRVRVYGSAQVGTNFYPFSVSTGVNGKTRTDNAWTYGGGASVLLFRTTVLQARVTQNSLQPVEGGAKRTVFRFTTGLSFNGEWNQ